MFRRKKRIRITIICLLLISIMLLFVHFRSSPTRAVHYFIYSRRLQTYLDMDGTIQTVKRVYTTEDGQTTSGTVYTIPYKKGLSQHDMLAKRNTIFVSKTWFYYSAEYYY